MQRLVTVPIVFTLVLLGIAVQAVDRNNFKTCEQSSFCRRCRKVAPGNSAFDVISGSVKTYNDYLTLELVNKENEHQFVMKLESISGENTFHVEIDEKTPLKARYRVTDSLKGPLVKQAITVTKGATETTVVSDKKKAVIVHSPFRMDFYLNDILTVSANAKGLMRFEHLRKKPEGRPHADGDEGEQQQPEGGAEETVKSIEDADPGSWEENFKGHHDSKPNGPEAIAMDFTFVKADVLFGIPEHADNFILKSTVGGDPYRLYNLDVFEFELNNGMALYGSVPVLYGHGKGSTAGVYWQNPSETWVDIYDSTTKQNVMSSIVNFVSGGGGKATEPPTAHFMSESGIVDMFILLGPSPMDAFKQYTALTGSAPLPQMFAIGYHQCRWNYNDEQDVAMVHNKFDEHDIPVDTIWLDIEYTEGKKYFTWDQHKFAHPLQMIQNLTERGRHLTIIIDPHTKRDSGYFFHNDCTDLGYYVKNKDGHDYEGYCWPGPASYADYFNPVVRNYYADQYLLKNFDTTTADVMLWNDMNEPSVFNGPEITMLKDNIHYGGWEHRHVHNLYGHMFVMGTHQGLLARSDNQQRPFILSRAHFAGTQRYAAIWTGDNFAQWDHMGASIAMCLSEAVAGISFCGADVGGFFGNPETELLERWYQLGAFLPFFRAHAHIDTKRREPWLFPEPTKMIIRDAIRKRYSYLPFWYTQFYEHERVGAPIMRPLLAQYPDDAEVFHMDQQFLIGDKLMVRAVLDKGAQYVDVYFPGSGDEEKQSEWWYDVDDMRKVDRVGWEKVAVNSQKVPVYQRGGTIVPKKERIRRSALLMKDDPLTLVVCVDKQNKAHGTIYLDDEKSFDYRQNKYLYLSVDFDGKMIQNRKIDSAANYATKVWLEKIIVAGMGQIPKSATLTVGKNVVQQQLEIVPQNGGNGFAIRKPGINIADNWQIVLNY